MAVNVNATTSWRGKWFQANLQETLKAALVAEKICSVDRSGAKFIWNPYGNSPTTTIQDIGGGSQGTYSVLSYTSVNDTLTVTDEFVCSEHIYDFERVMQNGDIMFSRMGEIINSIATAIDKYVINSLCEAGTGVYTTPAGGFTTAGNVNEIFAQLLGKFTGYAENLNGQYVVIEQTDVPGIVLAGVGSGFSYADSWLNNGFLGSHMGIDIYVKLSGTFVSATLGSTTPTNAGHRVAGIKGITTYAQPQDISWDEKGVSGKTGKEVVGVAYIGFNAWVQRRDLTIDITLA